MTHKLNSNNKSKLGRCPGRVTMNNKEVDICMDHNHNGDMAAAEAHTVLQDVRKRSMRSRDTPNFVVAECVTQVNRPALSQLP